MKSSVDTHLGSIQIDKRVIAQYAGTVANECFGIVGMASVNPKEGLVRILKKEKVDHGISVKGSGGKLILDFHVIIAYGVSIMAVTENLISNVKYKVESYTGLEVEKINIFVEGVRVID
ncbi:MAG: Asp23/Gls24 family envelope stress response protein [Lachnospiraceae bacterium]|nr:Asp23/Gls24 family envelope stress response protein [Lachnospiraceae bacterium]MCR4641398.1 Asp23/Gls24 family envelope stress response protein [Lachnospiraceae bacterium]